MLFFEFSVQRRLQTFVSRSAIVPEQFGVPIIVPRRPQRVRDAAARNQRHGRPVQPIRTTATLTGAPTESQV